MNEIVIFGNDDLREVLGFPTPEEFRHFIRRGIFQSNQGRYHHTINHRDVAVAVLAREHHLFGHFVICGRELPNAEDAGAYDRTRAVFLVCESVLYDRPVPLLDPEYQQTRIGIRIEPPRFNAIRQQARMALTTYNYQA